LFAFVALCLYAIPNTMVPLLIGLTLAYAFDPVIDFFEERGVPRKRAVFWLFLVIGGVFLLGITILLPYLFIQLLELIENLPSLLVQLMEWVSKKFHLETTTLQDNILNFVKKQYSTENFAKLANFIRVSFASTANWVFTLAGALIVPVFFYFFLVDIDRIKTSAFQLIPRPCRSFVRVRLLKVDRILSGFIRGQLTVAFILCILYSIGLSLVGIRYGFLIGFVSGCLNIVPYLGVAIGLSASLFMSFFGGNVWLQILGVLLVFWLIQTLEGFVITPKIVGDKVGLNPFTAIIALLIGGELFGIAGMLLAIPTAGVLRVILRDCKAAYLKSRFYKSPPPAKP
jgi:predicted PurR-regulated permease PerM